MIAVLATAVAASTALAIARPVLCDRRHYTATTRGLDRAAFTDVA